MFVPYTNKNSSNRLAIGSWSVGETAVIGKSNTELQEDGGKFRQCKAGRALPGAFQAQHKAVMLLAEVMAGYWAAQLHTPAFLACLFGDEAFSSFRSSSTFL